MTDNCLTFGAFITLLLICVSLRISPVTGKPSKSGNRTGGQRQKIDNLYYYSPETYGKTTHKNHKTNSFAYLYPKTSSTTTTTTKASPNIFHKRFGEISGQSLDNHSNESGQPYTQTDTSNKIKSSVNYANEETFEDLPRNMSKHHPDYYQPDLSSKTLDLENSKIGSAANSPVPSYIAQNKHISQKYGSGTNNGYPYKYHNTGNDAYYPTYYPKYDSPPVQYPSQTAEAGTGQFQTNPANDPSSMSQMNGQGTGLEPSNGLGPGVGPSGSNQLTRTGTWLGPGIAGLIIGILPLATLIASMIPAFISVPVISTSPFSRRRRHISGFDTLSFNDNQMTANSGALEILSKYGMSSLEDPQCLTEMFCTFAAKGRTLEKNSIQNIVYHLIDFSSEGLAKWLSMDTLFNAVKHNKCEPIYKCMSRKVKLKDTDRYNNN